MNTLLLASATSTNTEVATSEMLHIINMLTVILSFFAAFWLVLAVLTLVVSLRNEDTEGLTRSVMIVFVAIPLLMCPTFIRTLFAESSENVANEEVASSFSFSEFVAQNQTTIYAALFGLALGVIFAISMSMKNRKNILHKPTVNE